VFSPCGVEGNFRCQLLYEILLLFLRSALDGTIDLRESGLTFFFSRIPITNRVLKLCQLFLIISDRFFFISSQDITKKKKKKNLSFLGL
jgi:hypothetical protein